MRANASHAYPERTYAARIIRGYACILTSGNIAKWPIRRLAPRVILGSLLDISGLWRPHRLAASLLTRQEISVKRHMGVIPQQVNHMRQNGWKPVS